MLGIIGHRKIMKHLPVVWISVGELLGDTAWPRADIQPILWRHHWPNHWERQPGLTKRGHSQSGAVERYQELVYYFYPLIMKTASKVKPQFAMISCNHERHRRLHKSLILNNLKRLYVITKVIYNVLLEAFLLDPENNWLGQNFSSYLGTRLYHKILDLKLLVNIQWF